jgi:hypothetical protein
MTDLQLALTILTGLVAVPLTVYVLARLVSAAYFRSKQDHDEATTKGRCNGSRP